MLAPSNPSAWINTSPVYIKANAVMQWCSGVHLSYASPFTRWLTVRNSCSKLFIGGLSYDTNEPVLKNAFEQHGEIIEGAVYLKVRWPYVAVKVICHHVSGKSKGYGFVKFTSEDAASKALKEMDGQLVDGRNIRVHYAHRE